MQVDPGREFMGDMSKLLAARKTAIRRGAPGEEGAHRGQAIVERFNRTLAERLFGYQYAREMKVPGTRSTEWVVRLPAVVSSLNEEVTRLTGERPINAVKKKLVSQRPSTPYLRPVGSSEKKLPTDIGVRYLYQPGELEGGRKRATDPIWSLKIYRPGRSVTKPGEPTLYYLLDGPSRGFVREELLVVPPDTKLPLVIK